LPAQINAYAAALEVGAGVDYFDGSPNNISVLYAGTLEWRFGWR
jgi:hypothetical protein